MMIEVTDAAAATTTTVAITAAAAVRHVVLFCGLESKWLANIHTRFRESQTAGSWAGRDIHTTW
jgi:hypothetical protein